MHIVAEFWRSGTDISHLPNVPTPEIAIVGRSNVGKSTFINRLTNQNQLARASSTPGRTKELVLFQIKVKEERKKDKTIILTDLPGYGFAKVSKSQRENLQAMISSYVQHRENLSVVCILNDIRRPPEEDELGIRALAYERGAIVLVIATKCDKLSPNQRNKALAELARGYGLEPDDILISGEKLSMRPIWERILSIL